MATGDRSVRALVATVGAATCVLFILGIIGVGDVPARIPAGTAPAAVDTTPAPHWSPVVGRVVDAETGEPVGGAAVSIEPPERSDVSGPDGRFRLPELAPGTYRLRIRHLGYGTREVEAEVRAWTVTRVNIRLEKKAIEVEPIRVEVEHRPEHLIDAGFYRRREKGLGEFYDPVRLDSVLGSWSSPEQWMPALMMQHASTDISLRHCPPCGNVDLYIGREAGPTATIADDSTWQLENIASDEVAAVEIYPDGFGAPAFALPLPDEAMSLPGSGSRTGPPRGGAVGGDPRPTVVIIWLER